MLAVVLSGGGAKGAYEIGVWKALRRMHIKYDIVTGTSVGALNGVMMVQNNYHKAIRVWKKIDQSKILERENFENEKEMMKFYAKSGIHGGTEVRGLEEIMHKAVNEKRFFKSKVDFGIITYNLTKLKHQEIVKKKIKKGYLTHYVLASSTCFPFFKKKKIDEDNFIDGGFYDNLPINLAISLGATEIIAVDLKAVGFKKKVKDKRVEIISISPNNNTGSFLDFNRESAKKNIKFGYNDTMKIFEKCDGKYFTFRKNELLKNYDKYFDMYYHNIKRLFKNIKDEIFFSNFIIRKKKEGLTREYFNNIIEKCGKVFLLDETKIYRIKRFNKKILKKLFTINDGDKKNNSILDKKQIIRKIYVLLENKKYRKILKYDLLFHQEIIMAIYLYTISKNDII